MPRAIFLFYFGAVINVLTLFITLPHSFPESTVGPDLLMDGLTPLGRRAMWLIPIGIAALIVLAFVLKYTNRIRTANVLLWIPALPMLLAIVFSAFMALLFTVGGN